MWTRLSAQVFRIRTRLLLVNLLLVAIPVVGILFAKFYEREMLDALEADMRHQAKLVSQAISHDDRELDRTKWASILEQTAKSTRTRVRILGPLGQCLVDSHEGGPPEGPESASPTWPGESQLRSVSRLESPGHEPKDINLSQRSEVLDSLGGKPSSMTRFWENRDRIYLFVTEPIWRQGKVIGSIYVTRSTNPVRAALYRLRTNLIMILVASIIATAVLSLFLAQTISSPLQTLTQAALRMSSGDRTTSLHLRRRDEIGQLAGAFDTLLKQLDERARYIGELAANISHEFKSPLTGIRGAAELLRDGALDDPPIREKFLANICADVDRLNRLVSSLLELSRYESAQDPMEPISLTDVVAKTLSSYDPSRVRLVASRDMKISGRPAHLASAIRNLVENALQHASEGTLVEVDVEARASDAVVRVRNQGPEISAVNLSRIWDRFFTTRQRQGGTGLGLAIVATVVRSHGGTVRVWSNAQETVFEVSLPSVQAGPSAMNYRDE